MYVFLHMSNAYMQLLAHWASHLQFEVPWRRPVLAPASAAHKGVLGVGGIGGRREQGIGGSFLSIFFWDVQAYTRIWYG